MPGKDQGAGRPLFTRSELLRLVIPLVIEQFLLMTVGMADTVMVDVYKRQGPVFLLASVLFSYQLYCDFSACTDIAIGAGEMFGIRLMENFRRPLAAHSFTELWRRWHISLTN